MSFLKSKKQTYVSSVVYNLAGEQVNRADYLKSTVYGSVLSQDNTGRTVGQGINDAYIKGPGITYKNWYKSIQLNQPVIKLPTANIGSTASVDSADIEAAVSVPAGKTIWVQSSITGDADYMWWANKFILENYPSQYNSQWTADFQASTQSISILMADGTTHQFTPTDFDINAEYVYALYTLTANNVVNAWEYGVVTSPLESKPDTSGYTQESNTITSEPITLQTTVTTLKEYSDNSPNQETKSSSVESAVANNTTELWAKTEYLGQQTDTDSLVNRLTHLNIWQKYKIASATTVTKSVSTEIIDGKEVDITTTVTTDKDTVQYYYESSTDTQDTISLSLTDTAIFIYKLGSGGSLDKYINAKQDFGGFFPCIPVRVDNTSITKYGPKANGKYTYYTACAKAYKKLMGSDFDDLIDKVEDNGSLGDIDYALVNFGTALNTKSNACKNYIYTFFKELISYQTSSQSDYLAWKLKAKQQIIYQNKWNEWKAAQSDSSNPLYGTAEPITGNIQKPSGSSITIQSDGWMDFYKIQISWNYISETVHTGKAWDDAEVGDVQLSISEGDPMLVSMYLANAGETVDSDDLSDDTLIILYQATATEYRKLEVSGASHKNVIYQGKSVDTSAKTAINDSDESGFIIPLHYGIFNKTPLVARTQLTTECAYLTFNCYQVVKQKWYQTTLFKIVLIVAIVVISIYTGGASAPTGAGVLGANAAVGAAIGLTGIAAIVAGMATNALAAMVISTVLMRASTSVLGDKLGPLVGMLASMVVINAATSYQTGAGLAVNWGKMMTAPNLLSATQAVQSSYTAYATDKLQDFQSQATELKEQYNEKSEEIEDKTKEILGSNAAYIDPMMFTGEDKTVAEAASVFLSRTLVTGSDIAKLTHKMISEFASITNDLDTLKNQ